MDASAAFKQFGSQYFQGFENFVDQRDLDAMVRYGLEQLTKEQQDSLRDFLTELLKRKPSPEKLDELWLATGTDLYFSRGLDRFLAMTRDAIPD